MVSQVRHPRRLAASRSRRHSPAAARPRRRSRHPRSRGQDRPGVAADRPAGAPRQGQRQRRAARDRGAQRRKASTIGGAKVKFELVSEDDQADPKTGTIVAQKLVDAKVAGVIGHFNSGTTIPASKIYTDAGIPQISPSSTNPKYTAAGLQERVPRDGERRPAGQGAGRVRGGEARARRRSRSSTTAPPTARGSPMSSRRRRRPAGATIVAREYTTDKATDFRAILTRIKGKKPDLVFYGGMDPQAGPDGDADEVARHQGQVSRAATARRARSSSSSPAPPPRACGLLARAAARQDARRQGLCRQVQGQVRPDPDLRAVRLRCAMTLIDAMKRANSTDPAKYLPELAQDQPGRA